MSINKNWRERWVKVIYARAVTLFHRERKLPDNDAVPLADLARRCANSEFADAADTIVGDKETCARELMAYCREHFGDEIKKALMDIPTQEQEERVA